jgi:hypothetical protein
MLKPNWHHSMKDIWHMPAPVSNKCEPSRVAVMFLHRRETGQRSISVWLMSTLHNEAKTVVHLLLDQSAPFPNPESRGEVSWLNQRDVFVFRQDSHDVAVNRFVFDMPVHHNHIAVGVFLDYLTVPYVPFDDIVMVSRERKHIVFLLTTILPQFCKNVNRAFYEPIGGITPAKSSHDIRRTVATTLYRMGVPIGDIQRFLGHSDEKTTMGYIVDYESKANYHSLITESLSCFSVLNCTQNEDSENRYKACIYSVYGVQRMAAFQAILLGF